MHVDPQIMASTAEFRAVTLDSIDDPRVLGLEATLRRREAVLAAICYAASKFLVTEEWDADVRELLGRLGSAAEVRHVFLFEARSGEDGSVQRTLVHEWAADGARPLAADDRHTLSAAAWRPDSRPASARDRVTHQSVAGLSPAEQGFFEGLDVHSFVGVPVFAGDTWWGYLGLSDDSTARHWSNSVLDVLEAAAATIGATIYRKRNEEGLRQSEERFRLLAEAAAEGVLIHIGGRILEANATIVTTFGYTMEELIGADAVSLLVSPEYRDHVREQVRLGTETPYVITGRTKHGQTLTVEIRARRTTYRGSPARVVAINDITERQRAEAELRRREAQLNQAQGIANMGSWDWDIEANTLTGSDEMYRIYGFTVGEPLTTSRILSRIHPDDADRLRAAIDDAVIHGRDFEIEHRVVRTPTDIRIVHSQGRVVRNASGETQMIVGAGHDITDRRAAEELNRQHEADLAAAQAVAHMGGFVWDIETNELRGADELFRIFGLDPRASHTAHAILSRIHPDDAELVRLTIDRAMQDGGSYSVEHRVVRGPGDVRINRTDGRVVTNPDGSPRQLIGVCQDITERRQAEAVARQLIEEQAAREAAQHAERRAALLAEASRVLGSSFDYQTTLASLTRLAVPELADYCTVDIVGRDGDIQRVGVAHVDAEKEPLLWEITRWLKRDLPMAAHLRSALIEGKSSLTPHVDDDALAAVAIDEEHGRLVQRIAPRSIVAVPLKLADRVLGALALYMSESDRRYGPDDLTLVEELARRAALAIENARLFAEAEQATKARDQMLGIVAHDLRNPLSTILMASELLSETLDEGSMARRQVAIVQRAGDRMKRLIRDLLDIKRIENGRLAVDPRPVPSLAILTEAAETLRPLAAASGLELVLETPDELPIVAADTHRMQQVLSNLVGNAIKFTPREGRITVRGHRDGEEVRVTVEDTGPGIPPEQLPHIFGQFWQGGRNDRRGIGLGLSIAKGIIDAHGGRIWVESTVGSGSSFFFTLPANAASQVEFLQ